MNGLSKRSGGWGLGILYRNTGGWGVAMSIEVKLKAIGPNKYYFSRKIKVFLKRCLKT